MGFWADLHVHTCFSDGAHTPEEIVHFYGNLGCGAIAITDHLVERETFVGRVSYKLDRSLRMEKINEYFLEIRRVANLAWREYGMLVLPGYEITRNSFFAHKGSHYLVIGHEAPLDPATDLEVALDYYKKSGALLIAAHPLATGNFEFQTLELWSKREKLSGYFDAWEVNCAKKYFHEVAESGLPIIASTDLHHKKQINTWKTWFECERDPDALFEAIRKQDISVFDYSVEAAARPKLASQLPMNKPVMC